MIKPCLTQDEVISTCKRLATAFLAVNARDLATPKFETVEPAMVAMAELDTAVKQLFVRVLRNPEKLRNAPPSIIRFVHESMDFVENGNKRSINIEEWSKIVTMTLDTENGTFRKAMMGPHGPIWTHSNIRISDTTLFKPHESICEVKELSPCILLHKWLQRDQGMKDALIAYQLLGRIYATFYH